MVTLEDLRCESRFVERLPGDPLSDRRSRQVTEACYSRVPPLAASRPRLIAHSPETAALLGLSAAACRTPEFTAVVAGNALVEGMVPYAMCYGGHQFGHWAGQLGDGRAINLGEAAVAGDLRWALQLKGAGPTPYSRRADGFAVARSSLREFLCSEAMHHLGVPTTRALSIVLTGDAVVRDMLYDGHPRPEPGAVVCRVARSFVRFGNFEIFAARGDHERLRMLADFVRDEYFTGLTHAEMLAEIARRTAVMIAHWQRVGFVHGVMNTDNMSVLGDTIDYGPYGWLEPYDPDWTPNTTDAGQRRYRFGNQAAAGAWNVLQLARALHPLIGDIELLEAALDLYDQTYASEARRMQAQKLGFSESSTEVRERLVDPLLELFQATETDMTIFYRNLAKVDPQIFTEAEFSPAGADIAAGARLELLPAFYHPEALDANLRARYAAWFTAYAAELARNGISPERRRRRMDAVNPQYVLRNYLAQHAIDGVEQNDTAMLDDLMTVLRHPYEEQPEFAHLAAPRPAWAADRAGCSMLSCSS